MKSEKLRERKRPSWWKLHIGKRVSEKREELEIGEFWVLAFLKKMKLSMVRRFGTKCSSTFSIYLIF
jgi:hypothetical protein